MIIGTYHNEGPRDPDVIFCNGEFHYLFSYEDKLWIKSSKTIEGLKDAKPIVVYEPTDNSIWNTHIWAPELHFLNNKWHIYVTIGNHENGLEHMFVLTNDSDNPLLKYHKVSFINNGNDDWSIDATIIHYNNELYYVWSAFPSYQDRVPQTLYIAKMKDPYSIEYPRIVLSEPEYDWEKHGGNGGSRPYVNEGPFALYHNGKIQIVYSASGCWTEHYCLALLTFKGGDILDRNNWVKLDHPIFDNTSGYVGPGHASFIQNHPSGQEYCFFHAYEKDASGGEKYVFSHAEKMHWEGDIPVIESSLKK